MESGANNAGGYDPFAQAGTRVLRFRTQPERGSGSSRRLYRAAYSHADGSSRFRIDIDLVRTELTLHRGDDDYRAMLLDLAGHPPGVSRIPAQGSHLGSLSFDMEVIGLKMPAVQAVRATADRSGGWLVVRAFIPGGTASFLLGTSEPLAAGEIVIPEPKATRAVLLTLAKVFG